MNRVSFLDPEFGLREVLLTDEEMPRFIGEKTIGEVRWIYLGHVVIDSDEPPQGGAETLRTPDT